MTDLPDRLKETAPRPQRPIDLVAVQRRAEQLRRRSRSVAAAACVAVVAAGAGLAATVGARPAVTQVATTPPANNSGASGGAARTQGRGIVGAAVAFPTPQDGIVVLSASVTSTKTPAAAWVDTTHDGGRHWSRHRIPVAVGSMVNYGAGGLVMASPSDGWLGPWRTTNGGLSWSRSQSGAPLDGLVATARGGWAESGPGTYPWSAPGEPFAPLTSTPHGSGAVVRTSSTDAFELGASNTHTPVGLLRTLDGGRQWGSVTLPCSLKAHHDGGPQLPAGPNLVAAGPGGSLWLACWASIGSMDGSEGVVTLYRSADAGASWQRMTPPGSKDILDTLGGLYPLAGGVEWAVESDSEAGLLPPLRSTDNGRTWHPVLPRHLPGNPESPMEIDSIAVTSADNAWVAATAYRDGNANGVPVLLHTTNGGRHWTTIDLPW